MLSWLTALRVSISKFAMYFNYCSLVWSNCTAADAHRLQLAQNFVARVTWKHLKSTSASEARTQLGWLSLEDVRSVYFWHLLHSAENGSATPYICALVNPTANCHSYSTRAPFNNYMSEHEQSSFKFWEICYIYHSGFLNCHLLNFVTEIYARMVFCPMSLTKLSVFFCVWVATIWMFTFFLFLWQPCKLACIG